MKYLGEIFPDQFAICIETDEEMNRLYDWNYIRNGLYCFEQRTIVSPWHRQFNLGEYIHPDFKDWLRVNAENDEGMPLYALRWENGYFNSKQYYSWRLRIHFYRERTAALFRLTFG